MGLAIALAWFWWEFLVFADDLDGRGQLARLIAPIPIAVLGFAGAATLALTIRDKPTIVIRHDHVQLTDYGILPFGKIEKVELRQLGRSGRVLSFHPKDPKGFWRRVPPLGRISAAFNRYVSGVPRLSIGVSLMQPTVEVVAWYLRERGGVEVEGVTPNEPDAGGGDPPR